VVYARVSSADQRADLDRHVARLSAWTGGQGIPVGRVVTEVGSALNGERRTFLALFRDPDVATIVVEHRDWFARFGEPPQLPILGASVSLPTVSVTAERDRGRSVLPGRWREVRQREAPRRGSVGVRPVRGIMGEVGALVPDDAEAARWR